jgi:NAD(P)H-hydrate epimerase
MEGAIMLAAQAALETGVGMISLLTTEKSRVVIAGKIPELITHGIPDGLAEKGIAAYIDDFFRTHRYDALVIGPGMGRSNAACTVFNHILLMADNYNLKHILIDGDGLFHLADFLKENDLDDRIDFLITPHFFEASRILGKDVDELKMNRLHSARELSRATASVALLKGPNSIVTDGEYALINTTGNESLATAGSGDVLSGIIGSLMLRQETALEAASIGVYVHGKAADMFCSEHETDVLKAGDLVGYIRKVQSSTACDCGGHDH